MIGRCITSIKAHQKIVMKPREELNENQYVEFGEYVEDNDGSLLLQLCLECWRSSQDKLRSKQLIEYRTIVIEALKDITDIEVANLGLAPAGNRRAVVFYADSMTAMRYLQWWIYTWRFIGLNDAKEAFDIVVLIDPQTEELVPDECDKYSRQFSAQVIGPRRCIYKLYDGTHLGLHSLISNLSLSQVLLPGTVVLT